MGTLPKAGVALALASAGAVLAVFFGPLRSSGTATAVRLTNQAYTAQRPFALRFSGAEYAPVKATRPSTMRRSERPVELYDAEAAIRRGLDKHPDDPQWLDLQGRADLLEDQPEVAVTELERAHALRPADARVLCDLGIAYYLSARNGDERLYSKAFDSFGQGLKVQPSDRALLFNKALAAHQMQTFQTEQSAWQTYLSAESSGGWAGEAREGLRDAQKRLAQQRDYAVATTPQALVAELQLRPSKQLYAADEEYLGVPITRLLVSYYSGRSDPETRNALESFARLLIDRHKDTWLQDLLKTPRTTRARAAFEALGQAVEANDRTDAERGEAAAERATRLFRDLGNKPGTLRAEYEHVHAFQMRRKYSECLAAVHPLWNALSHSTYSWLQTKVLIEEVPCELFSGKFEESASRLREAIATAGSSAYLALWLRTLGSSAHWKRQIGNAASAWRDVATGLARYWSGRYSLSRAQYFYAELIELAREAGLSHASVAFAQEAASLDRTLGDRLSIASSFFILALTEMSAGMEQPAIKDFNEALRQEQGDRRTVLRMHVDMAAAEDLYGLTKQPLERLQIIEPEMSRQDDAVTKIRFYGELGRLRLKTGEVAKAREDLERARAIGESTAAPPGDRLAWTRAMGTIYRALVECAVRSGTDAHSSWELWSGYRAALFETHTPGMPPRYIPQPSEALLSFAELPSGVIAWLAAGSDFDWRWIGQADALRDAADRVLRECSSPRSPLTTLHEDAAALSRQLLGPWEAKLEGIRSVVVETDTAVATVPWAALIRSNGHYWLEALALRIRAGAANDASRPPALSPKLRILAVGAPAIAEEGLPPLPNAREEAEKVSARFDRYILLTGASATLGAVRRSLSDMQLFHFAGHGYGSEGGGLLLRGPQGEAGLLRASDIQMCDLSSCRLVVLSACSAAAGERGGPGDPQSLVRAFLRAGVQEVVAASWNLDSAATPELMNRFYDSMLLGSPAAEALRQAAAGSRAGAIYSHPYFWAGMAVYSGN